ncbi:MAG: V-type ATP synthase subunit C [Halobacteriota archaeon]|jgi:V/A-type H+-transporting ATPase subunit C
MYAQQKKRKHSGSVAKSRYAYGNARVHAMKVKLFPKETYAKLLVMDLPEIARFIEESEYKAEVDELARTYSGIDLVEFATHLNLARTFRKLIDMTMGEPHDLIVEYLRRWDIWDIKTILRGKAYGASDDEILRILVPSGELSIEFLQNLVRKPSVGEVVAALKGTVYYNVIKDIEYAESSMRVEDELDKFYYARMVDASRIIGFSLYLKVVRMEIDVANLKTLFRLKTADISGSRVLQYIIPNGLYLTDKEIEKLADAPFNEFIEMLSKYRYWGAISDIITERMESLSKIELRLDKYLNEHVWKIATYNPLTVLPMLGYMLSKDAEVDNIQAIVRGKEAGLSQEIIKSHLVL